MPLETATYVSDLIATNPAHTDGLSQADSHLRLLKAALKATFPNVVGATTISQAQLNAFAGDGSLSLPAYSFVSDPTLGFYKPAAGTIAFTGVLQGNGACPPGALMDFATTAAPTGWMSCDGAAVSRTTYANLFAAVGTTWGAGDGSTTFNVPNMLSRFRRHRDNATYSGAVGNLQNPANTAHTHAVVGTTSGHSADHSHSGGGTTGNDSPDHAHGFTTPPVVSGGGAIIAGGGSYPASGFTGVTSGANVRHAHTYSFTTSGVSADHTHSMNFASQGGTADANETRPWSVTVLTCIKT